MANKLKELSDVVLDGQISIFDVFTEKYKKVTEKKALDTEKTILNTNIDKMSIIHHEITLAQQIIIDKYKSKDNINRIIHYGGGGVGIELKKGDEFKTIYVNKQGLEEIKWDKQIRVLDMDKVIFTLESKHKEGIGKRVRVGDYIKAYYSKEEIIQGTITHTYGLGDECLCINFLHNKKKSSTAIPRSMVIEIISSIDEKVGD